MWDVLGEEKCVQGLVSNPVRRRPLWKPWHKWEDSFKMDVTEFGWQGIDWIHLARVSRFCWTQWWTSIYLFIYLLIRWLTVKFLKRLSSMVLSKYLSVILINSQFWVVKVTRGTTAATSDGATREGHHENIMDVSSKWIWSLHAE